MLAIHMTTLRSRTVLHKLRRTTELATMPAPLRNDLMKSMLRLSLALALILSHGSVPVEARAKSKSSSERAGNLIRNGGFEQRNARSGAEHWKISQHAGVRAYDFEVVEDPAHGDKHSMLVRRTREQVWGQVAQWIPVTPELVGKDLELVIWVRGEGVGKKGYLLRLGAFSGSNLLIESKSEPITGDSDWTRRSLRLTVPEYTTQINVSTALEDAGTIWIDDASLKVVESK